MQPIQSTGSYTNNLQLSAAFSQSTFSIHSSQAVGFPSARGHRIAAPPPSPSATNKIRLLALIHCGRRARISAKDLTLFHHSVTFAFGVRPPFGLLILLSGVRTALFFSSGGAAHSEENQLD